MPMPNAESNKLFALAKLGALVSDAAPETTEHVARAIHDSRWQGGAWDKNLSEASKEAYRRDASAAIAALKEIADG